MGSHGRTRQAQGDGTQCKAMSSPTQQRGNYISKFISEKQNKVYFLVTNSILIVDGLVVSCPPLPPPPSIIVCDFEAISKAQKKNGKHIFF